MKYKLLKELPFMKVGSIFGKGCWVGGGWGVDKGNSSTGAHNGVTTFEKSENEILDNILTNKEWILQLPESVNEVLNMLEDGYFTLSEAEKYIEMKGTK